nr:hypothetical protein [Tanacetum cinerariifolium]
DDGNGEEDQGLRISEEERMHEEEEADEVYHDIDINQGRGLQVSQDIDDSHVTLTPVHSDGQQETSQPPIPPTPIPSEVLQNLSTFKLVFRFEDRVKSLEVNFSEFIRTNQSPEAVSNIPGPSGRSDRGSKRRREGGEHASANTLSEPATRSAGRSTTQTQSRQMYASESAFIEEPVQTTCQMEEPSHSVFETGAEDQPIV